MNSLTPPVDQFAHAQRILILSHAWEAERAGDAIAARKIAIVFPNFEHETDPIDLDTR